MNKFINNLSKYTPKILFIFFSIVLYIVCLFGSQDNDMFFEISSGRDLLKGNFETASHLNNFPMIVQQWLYAATLAIFDNLGYFGHILLVFLQNVLLWTVSGIFIYRKTTNKKLSILGPFFITLYCSEYMINIRPQIITMILLVTELILIDIYRTTKSTKYLLLNIPILILEANFHQAIFLYHIFILAPYYIKELRKPVNFKDFITIFDWKLIFITPLYITCSLCTPYGIKGFMYIVNTFRSKTYDIITISELTSMSPISFIGIKYLLLLAVTIYLIYKHKSNLYINFYTFSIFILALISIRHISIMYLVPLFIVCYIDKIEIKESICQILYYILFILTAAMSLLLATQAKDIRETNYGGLISVIQDKDALIYNADMDVGGYFEYNGYTKIALDSRCEAFSKEISGVDNVIRDYMMLSKGYLIKDDGSYTIPTDEYILSIVESYDYVISGKLQYFNRIAIKNNWVELYKDESYIIWQNPK